MVKLFFNIYYRKVDEWINSFKREIPHRMVAEIERNSNNISAVILKYTCKRCKLLNSIGSSWTVLRVFWPKVLVVVVVVVALGPKPTPPKFWVPVLNRGFSEKIHSRKFWLNIPDFLKSIQIEKIACTNVFTHH